MLKKTILCLLGVLCLFAGTVFADDSEIVKIGLTYQSPSYNQGEIRLTQAVLKEDGDQWALLGDILTFALESGYRVQIGETLDDQASFKEQLTDAFSIDAELTVGFGNGYRIYSQSFDSLSEAENFVDSLPDDYGKSAEIVRIENKVVLYGGMLPALIESESVKLLGSEGRISYTGRKYRGTFSFAVIEEMISVINQVSIQDYLYGVVPCEMEYYWPAEALKAQAIVARTYLLKNLGRFSHLGFDLTDTSSSQVYKGVSSERRQTTEAVDSTDGLVVTYEGSLIHAYYHASSGGVTANSENVWSGKVPYLKSVEDGYSLGAPNGNWSISYTASQLEDLLKEKGYDCGNVESVSTGDISFDGRVQELILSTDRGSINLIREQARSVLGYNSLKSILYTVGGNDSCSALGAGGTTPVALSGITAITSAGISPVQPNGPVMVRSASSLTALEESSGTFTFEGQGWGHGVGLSQWGAKTMAEQGRNAEEIIQYYYKDVELVER